MPESRAAERRPPAGASGSCAQLWLFWALLEGEPVEEAPRLRAFEHLALDCPACWAAFDHFAAEWAEWRAPATLGDRSDLLARALGRAAARRRTFGGVALEPSPRALNALALFTGLAMPHFEAVLSVRARPLGLAELLLEEGLAEERRRVNRRGSSAPGITGVVEMLALPALEAAGPAAASLRARAQGYLAAAQARRRRLFAARRGLQRAWEEAPRVSEHGDIEPVAKRVLHHCAAGVAFEHGELERALGEVEAALACADRGVPPQMELLLAQARLARRLGRREEALASATEAKEILEDPPGGPEAFLEAVYLELGLLADLEGDAERKELYWGQRLRCLGRRTPRWWAGETSVNDFLHPDDARAYLRHFWPQFQARVARNRPELS